MHEAFIVKLLVAHGTLNGEPPCSTFAKLFACEEVCMHMRTHMCTEAFAEHLCCACTCVSMYHAHA